MYARDMYLDIAIVQFFQSLPLEAEPWRTLVLFFADSLIYAVILLFIATAMIEYARLRNAHLYLLAAASTLVTRFLLVPLIHVFYQRERPYLALGFEPLTLEVLPSFPSGHTIFFFALAMATWYIHQRFAVFLFVCGALAGVARIAAGVHYPSDIIGGAVLGILAAMILRHIFRPYIERPLRKVVGK